MAAFGIQRQRQLYRRMIKSKGLDSDEEIEILAEAFEPISLEPGNVVGEELAASRGSQSPVPTIDDDGTIPPSRHIVDKIDHVCQVSTVPEVDAATWNAMMASNSFSEDMEYLSRIFAGLRDYIRVLSEWDEMALKSTKAAYPTGETQMTAYWQTLCAGHFPEGYEKAEADFHLWRKALRGPRLVKRPNVFDWKTPGVMTLLTTLVGSFGAGRNNRIFATMAEPTLRRRLARTVRGYLALVPAEAKAADMITILRGGRLPFVLRSRGGPWELIGASYVHGIMHGEAFDEELCGNVRIC